MNYQRVQSPLLVIRVEHWKAGSDKARCLSERGFIDQKLKTKDQREYATNIVDPNSFGQALCE